MQGGCKIFLLFVGQFIKSIYAEVAALFPDHYLHVGADVVRRCFRQAKQAQNYSDTEIQYALKRAITDVVEHLAARNKTTVIWEVRAETANRVDA